MTQKLFWDDSYLKEFTAKVKNVNGNTIILDRTAFYPTGGGQPNDTGMIKANGEIFKVTDVKKTGEDILHILDKPFSLPVDTEISGEIDWDRRYALMRHHTAIHVIDGIIEKEYHGTATGGQIYTDRARVDFDLPTLNSETALEIIAKSQAVINEGHNIRAKVITQAEALKIPNLARTEPGRELIKLLPEIRVLEIEGFDFQSDGGTHVANTKEVGTIKFNRVDSKGTHRKRMDISLS